MSNWAKLQEDMIQLPVFKRARHGIHFQNNDGSITANFSGKPCHFQDTDGLWKPIDTKLLPLGDGYYGCPHSKVKIKPDGTVAVAGTDYAQRVELPTAQTGLVDGDKLVRKFSFGEQRMWVTEDGFKSEIQLNRIPTLTEARKLIASESGTLSKEYMKSLTTATDANGDTHTYSTLTAFRTWLAGASFPVVIDPDFTADTGNGFLRGRSTTYATARATCTYTYNAGTEYSVSSAKLGSDFYVDRLYLYFDTSSIGAGSTVNQVNMKMTTTDRDGSTDFDVVIRKYDYSAYLPITSGNRDTVFDGILAATSDDAILCKFSNYDYNERQTSGNLSKAWVNKSGTTYYGLISSADIAGTTPAEWNPLKFASANHATEGYRPVLTVTYTASGIAIPVAQYYYNRLRRN